MSTSSVRPWNETMLEDWQKTRPIITNVLYKYNSNARTTPAAAHKEKKH